MIKTLIEPVKKVEVKSYKTEKYGVISFKMKGGWRGKTFSPAELRKVGEACFKIADDVEKA